MKKLSFLIILTLILSVTLTSALAIESADGTKLNGAHYNLNIIGVQNTKTADMTDNNGHTIFVPIVGKAKIELKEAPEGESFKVLDGNATDGSPAQFQLPKPGLDPYVVGEEGEADTVSDYSVFVRPLGKPGGWTTITTCASLLDSSMENFLSKDFIKILNSEAEFGGYASVEQVGSDITLRTKGKTQFTNVTAQLLTIVFKVEIYEDEQQTSLVATEYVRVPIFDEMLDGEYWEYDNNGLKLLQVRFYPFGTDVSEADLLLPSLED